MSKKVTSKVHGEMMAARKAKREAKATAKSNGGFAAELEAQVAKMTKAGVAVKANHQVKDGMPPRRKSTATPTPQPTETTTDLEPGDPADALELETDLCTFAIRLPKADRDAIHKAAGPAKATKFVRALAVAAARGDLEVVTGMVNGVLERMR